MLGVHEICKVVLRKVEANSKAGHDPGSHLMTLHHELEDLWPAPPTHVPNQFTATDNVLVDSQRA